MAKYTDLILNLEVNESSVMENLGEMAAKIAYYNFEWRFFTLLIFDSIHVLTCVETFLSSFNNPVILKFGEFLPRHRVPVTQFVIFGYDSNELAHMLAWMAQSNYDVSAKIIIICANEDYKRCDQDEVFHTISKVFMVNSVFLRPTKDNEVATLTYYPMKPTNCVNSSPEEIDIDVNCTSDFCRTAFPEKLHNFYGCALYISSIHQPPYMYLENANEEPYGADGDIIKVVANILNATLKMKLPVEKTEWGHSVDNNWTGSLGDVFNKRVHASVASVPLTPTKYGNFQISYPYYSMEMVWTTRLPDLKPSWDKLFRPLEIDTRIAIFAMFITIVIVEISLKSKMWNKIRKPLHVARSKTNFLFKSFSIFLGMSVSRLPSKTAFKIIVFSWILFSFIIRCAYQATLFNILKTNYYDAYFTDIRDVINHGYSYGGLKSLRDYYADEKDIFNNWEPVRSLDNYDLFQKVMDGHTDYAIAMNKASVLYYLSRSNGSKHLQIIPGQIVISPTVMYFKKFSPFIPAINRILRVLSEAGITDMIYARYLDQASYVFEHPSGYGTDPLGFGHFGACFMFLGIGWLISIVYFAVEMFYKPIRNP